MHGTQTALVVGLGAPVHTDCDHRIKVQFHWQKGTNGTTAKRPAPASDASGTWVTADKAVEVASTSAMVQVTAPKHVLLTAAGAAIELKGSNITLKGPGKVEFKASMKEWAGPKGASASLRLKQPGELKGCAQRQVKGLDALTEF